MINVINGFVSVFELNHHAACLILKMAIGAGERNTHCATILSCRSGTGTCSFNNSLPNWDCLFKLDHTEKLLKPNDLFTWTCFNVMFDCDTSCTQLFTKLFHVVLTGLGATSTVADDTSVPQSNHVRSREVTWNTTNGGWDFSTWHNARGPSPKRNFAWNGEALGAMPHLAHSVSNVSFQLWLQVWFLWWSAIKFDRWKLTRRG